MSAVLPIGPATRIAGPYVASGGQTTFSYAFPTIDPGDLRIETAPASAPDDWSAATLGVHYSLSGSFPNLAGGNVMFLTGRTAGTRVRILGRAVIANVTDPLPAGPVDSFKLNRWFDRLTIWAQELRRDIDNALSLLANGSIGWTAIEAMASFGERRVRKIVDWVGGNGPKPASNRYVGAAGLVDDIAQAVNIRGPAGAGVHLRGVKATSGELPVAALEGDAWVVGSNLWVFNGSIWQNAGPLMAGVLDRSNHIGFTTGDIASKSIPFTVTSIYTSGFAVQGDGGGALLKRIGANPNRPGAWQDALGAWWTLADTEVSPEVVGGNGDEAADNAKAFRDLYDAFPTGKVRIVLRPGASYLSGGSLYLRDDWELDAYGAKIKRIDEYKTTTTQNIAAGTTSIVVANASGFRVGHHISVYSGATYETTPHRITAIVGNTLTVIGGWQVGFVGGGTVITCGYMVSGAGAEGAKVFGLEVDDNMAGNTSLNKWQTHAAIEVYGRDTVVEDTYLHHCCSEGIVGGGGGRLLTNRIDTCNGNGIHLTGGIAGHSTVNGMATVIGNDVRNTSLDINTGHNEGAIGFSFTDGAFIANNYLDTGICGVGNINSQYASNTHIVHNIIKNMSTYAFEGIVSTGETLYNIFIDGNQIENCVSSGLICNAAPENLFVNSGIWNAQITNNVLINTVMSVRGVRGLRMSNNRISGPSSTSVNAFEHAYLIDAIIDTLSVEGGAYGIRHAGGSLGVLLNSPKCINNYYGGITGIGGDAFDVNIRKDISFEAASNWIGVNVANGENCLGGVLRAGFDTTATQIGVLLPAGGSGVRGGTVVGFIVLAGGLQYDYRAFGGSSNNVVRNCGYSGTLGLAGTGEFNDNYPLPLAA